MGKQTFPLFLPFQSCEGSRCIPQVWTVFCDCHEKQRKGGKMNDLKKQEFLETRNVKIQTSAGPCSLWRLHGDCFFRLSGSPKRPLLYLWLQSSHHFLSFIFCCGLSPSLGIWALKSGKAPSPGWLYHRILNTFKYLLCNQAQIPRLQVSMNLGRNTLCSPLRSSAMSRQWQMLNYKHIKSNDALEMKNCLCLFSWVLL